MYQDIPDRPDLKMGGDGDEQWIEIDFYWESRGVCLLLDQLERHSRYTRSIDLARDALLRDLGLLVRRTTPEEFDGQTATVLADIDRMLREGRPRRVFVPEGSSRAQARRREPSVNVTRNVGWLAGRPGVPAVPESWPRHYDRDRVSWSYDPGSPVLVPLTR
jgi:hypothetical protein